jgi:hypothetical protein
MGAMITKESSGQRVGKVDEMDVDQDASTGLIAAAMRGDMSSVVRMCDSIGVHGWNLYGPNYQVTTMGRTALHVAAFQGHEQVVEFLLPRMEMRHIRTTVTMLAATGRAEMLDLVLDTVFDFDLNEVDADGKLPLVEVMWRVKEDDDDDRRTAFGRVVDVLWRHGADMSAMDVKGWTPRAVATGGRMLS